MPLYQFEALDAQGLAQHGSVEAADARAAAQSLRARALYVPDDSIERIGRAYPAPPLPTLAGPPRPAEGGDGVRSGDPGEGGQQGRAGDPDRTPARTTAGGAK